MAAAKTAEPTFVPPVSAAQHAVAAAVVALALAALLWPLLLADRVPAMRDAGHYYYPLFQWCAAQWGEGRVPLWNAAENGGTAVCADPTASLWYPGKLVFALPLEFANGYKLYIVGHLVLCAVAAGWLARRWGAGGYGSALAALAYSCGGSVLFQHSNVIYLVGAAWLPFALGLLDLALREGRWRAAIGLGVVLALMILGGDPQMAYHVVLLGGLYVIVLWASGRQAADGGVPSQRARFALLAASALIAFLLAAAQILPSAQATASSERAQADRPRNVYETAGLAASGRLDWSQAREGVIGPPQPRTHHATVYDFSIAPWRLAELVWPNVGGRMYPTHRRWFSLLPQEPRIWSPALYLGLLPLVLGLSAVSLRSADSRIRWLSWSVVLFTLGSLGTFGLGWLARQLYVATGGSNAGFRVGDGVGGVYWLAVVLLPKYVLFRYPAKLLVVASLGISVLAAVGWDRAWANLPRRTVRALVVLGAVSGIAAVAALIASRLVTIGQGALDPAFGPFDSGGAWIDITTSFVHAAVIAFAASWLLRQASGGREPPESSAAKHSLYQAALLSLCAIELVVANYWLVPTVRADVLRQRSPIAEAIARDGAQPRVYRAPGWWPPEFAAGSSPHRLEEIVAWERATLAGRYALLDGVHLVNSQSGLTPADRAKLLDAVQARASSVPDAEALRQLGVEYLILPGQAPTEFAAPVPVDSLPSGTVLRRVAAPAATAADEPPDRLDSRTFYRGAAISAAAWIVLALGAIWVLASGRRIRSSS